MVIIGYALKLDEEKNRGGRKDFIIESIGGIKSWWRDEKTRDKTGRIGEHTRRTLLRRTPKQDFGQKEARKARNTVAYRWWVNDVIAINLTSNRFDEGTLFSPHSGLVAGIGITR